MSPSTDPRVASLVALLEQAQTTVGQAREHAAQGDLSSAAREALAASKTLSRAAGLAVLLGVEQRQAQRKK